MRPELSKYLASVSTHSRLDPAERDDLVRELNSHLEEEIEELCEAGYTSAQAVDMATRRLGSAREIGREMYEVYSVGTWRQALLSALPHLLVAGAFAFHLWRMSFWMILVIGLVVVGVTLGARMMRRPPWYYSWLGYSILLLLALVFLLAVMGGRSGSFFGAGSSGLWVAMVVYIGLALCVLGWAVLRVVERDWLFASLMLLPFPVLLVWLVALERDVGLAAYAGAGSEGRDTAVGLTCLLLAAVSALFVRARKRGYKAAALGLGTLLTLAIVWRSTQAGFSPAVCFGLAVFASGLLMGPFFLQWTVGRWRQRVGISDKRLGETVPRRTS